MKRLVLLAALLALASTAYAQSDSRKVAVLMMNGNNSLSSTSGPYRTTGAARGTSYNYPLSECHQIVEEILMRTGTPVVYVNMADSANGFAKSLRAARAAGVADSTHFRNQGILGCIVCMASINTGENIEPLQAFRNETTVGRLSASPLGGYWGIPVLVFSQAMRNEVGLNFNCGITNWRYSVTPYYQRAGFVDNGDSIAIAGDPMMEVNKSQSDSATVIIAGGDTLTSATNWARAWKWRTSTYYYLAPTAARPATGLLGIAKLFQVAGYTPRQKLTLHMTNDDVYSRGLTSVAAESAYAYMRTNNWRMTGGVGCDTYAKSLVAPHVKTAIDGYTDLFANQPHSHDLFMLKGSYSCWAGYGGTTAFNMTNHSDTALVRQRYLWMEASIRDTMQMDVASGYERTAMYAGDSQHYPYLGIWADLGYTDTRAPGAATIDTLGCKKAQSMLSWRYLYANLSQAATMQRFQSRPFLFASPGGRTIWVHGEFSHPGSDDTCMTDVDYDLVDDIHGKASINLRRLSAAIIWDSDFYWHGADNLNGQSPFMAIFFRRMSYFLNRISNICTLEPTYRPKVPRRHNNPRS